MKNFLCISFLLMFVRLWAQDPNFSQFYNNPVYYNPSMTGINNGLSVRLNSRNLWAPIPGKFNTYSGGIEAQTAFRTSLGCHAYSDVAGEAMLRTTGGYFTYSYRPVDNKNFVVQAGLGGGFITKSIDWSKLEFSDQYDETLGKIRPSAFGAPNYNKVSYADFNAGVVVRFNAQTEKSGKRLKKLSATIGAAMHHLSRPSDAFLNTYHYVPMRFVVHGTTNLMVKGQIYAPGIVYEQQREFKTFTAGLNYIVRPFSFGIWFRNRTAGLSFYDYDSFIFTLGINVQGKNVSSFRVMYGFDMTISRLRTSSYGTHEISLIIDMDKVMLFQGKVSRNALKRRYQCPTDFQGYQ